MEVNETGLSSGGQVLTAQLESVLDTLPSSPVSDMFAKAWVHMTDHYSRFTIVAFGSLLLQEVAYFGLCAPAFIFQFLPYMRRFKIRKDHTENLESQWKCFRLLMFNHFCVQLPAVPGLYLFMQYYGIPHDYDSMPRWYQTLGQILLLLVIEDTWHYWIHRLGHDRRLYKHVHKIHHHFQAPFGMVAEYAHPVETLVLGMGFFIGLPFICNHLITLWAWTLLRLLETVDVHTGYDIPYINPLHLLPGYAGARFHDFHHMNFVGNYASTFRWWDWLCGTDVQYKQYVQKQKAAAKQD